MNINNAEEEIEKINIITLGDTGVGKTCYILKYTDDFFQPVHLSTVGVDFKLKLLTFNDQKYRIYLYDTTGQERFKSISLNIIKNADGIILMYDITLKDTFKEISDWMNSIKQIKRDDFPIVLVGNKCDLEEERSISKEDGENLAKQHNIEFFETSNKNGINIEESALTLIKKIIEYKKLNGDLKTIKLKQKKTIKKKNCSC